MCPCFVTGAASLGTSLFGTAVAPSVTPLTRPARVATTPRAELDLVPGLPSGEDARDNAPLRHFVPVPPVETYEKRSFTTPLPQTWEGDVQTIGASDVKEMQVAQERKIIQVDAASTGAFVDFVQLVKDDRQNELDALKERNAAPTTGRATCGEEEGKTYVSNYRAVLVEGVKAVEYWGAPNGPVPKLFGGPTA